MYAAPLLTTANMNGGLHYSIPAEPHSIEMHGSPHHHAALSNLNSEGHAETLVNGNDNGYGSPKSNGSSNGGGHVSNGNGPVSGGTLPAFQRIASSAYGSTVAASGILGVGERYAALDSYRNQQVRIKLESNRLLRVSKGFFEK